MNVAAWTQAHDAAVLEEACVAHDVPVATAYTSADMFTDPHFAARGDLMTIADPVAGPMRQQAPYPRFVGSALETPIIYLWYTQKTFDVKNNSGTKTDVEIP